MLHHLGRRLVLQEWRGRLCVGKWSGRAALRASCFSGPIGRRTVSGWQQWLQWSAITRYVVRLCGWLTDLPTRGLVYMYKEILWHLGTLGRVPKRGISKSCLSTILASLKELWAIAWAVCNHWTGLVN